jgi:hypothetical protein
MLQSGVLHEKFVEFGKQLNKAIGEAFKVPLSQLTSLQVELANFEIDHDK